MQLKMNNENYLDSFKALSTEACRSKVNLCLINTTFMEMFLFPDHNGKFCDK